MGALSVNENSRPSQCEQVRRHMLERGSITPREARDLYDIWRLSGRIHELRARGVEIATRTIRKNGKAYACYSIKQS